MKLQPNSRKLARAWVDVADDMGVTPLEMTEAALLLADAVQYANEEIAKQVDKGIADAKA